MVPTSNSYLEHGHNFGQQLRHHCDGEDRRLLDACVGMNLWFVQARGTPVVDPALSAYCKDMTRRMIRLIRPMTILCLSQRAFRALATARASKFGDTGAPCKLAAFEGIPMIYAHHPTGQWTRRRADISIPVAIARIKDTLPGGQASDAPKVRMVPCHATSPITTPGISECRPAMNSLALSAPGRGERTFRITPEGRALLKRPKRAKQLAAIVELIANVCDGDPVGETLLVRRMGEHPVLRTSDQTPKALLNWYRTHHLIPERLAMVG